MNEHNLETLSKALEDACASNAGYTTLKKMVSELLPFAKSHVVVASGAVDLGTSHSVPQITGHYQTVRFGQLSKFTKSSCQKYDVVENHVVLVNKYLPGNASTPATMWWVSIIL